MIPMEPVKCHQFLRNNNLYVGCKEQITGISGYDSTCTALTASFSYDALNRRISKTINTTTTQFVYDRQDIVQEIQGTVTNNYIRNLNIDEPLTRIKGNGTIRHYTMDALGSVIELTDDTGAVKTTYTYDPFGNVTVSGETSDNPFQYTGRENDGTRLYYYRARYYSPELQRFISEDSILHPANVPPEYKLQNVPVPSFESRLMNPLNLNAFAFTRNNPVNLTDPMD